MWLSAETDLSVIGEAADGEEAVELVTMLQPDVVVMDVEMPKMDGIAATRALRGNFPRSEIIVLTGHDDECTRLRAQEAGAAAFVAKSTPMETLLTTIREVAGE